MLLKNAIKQLVRTPTRSLLFMLLVMLCTLFLAVGVNLYSSSVQNIADAEKTYRTIGTVEQKKDGVVVKKIWSQFDEAWIQYNVPTYTNIVDHTRLAGLPYTTPLEKREFYRAYVPQLNPAIYGRSSGDKGYRTNELMLEFEPLETFDAVESGRIKVLKYIFNPYGQKFETDIREMTLYGNTPELLDGEKTLVLEKGKSYVAYVQWYRKPNEDQYKALILRCQLI